MERKLSLLFGIIGSLVLVLLNNTPLGLSMRGYVTDILLSILSLLGLITMVYFSILLIIDTIKTIYKK